MRKTGPMNEYLKRLIAELKKRAIENDAAIWKRVATDLEKPTRQRKIVNLSRINRNTTENEVVIIPGKILASGGISHKLTVVAFTFSKQAKKKVESAGGRALTIEQFVQESPKNTNLRIIG